MVRLSTSEPAVDLASVYISADIKVGGRGSKILDLLLFLLCRLENLERAKQTLIYAHHSAGIVKLATVVWCTEQSNELPLRKEFVAILDHLMCSADKVHVVLLQETGDDIGTKCEGHATIVFTPTCDVLVLIRPQKVTKKAAVGNLKRQKGQHALDL